MMWRPMARSGASICSSTPDCDDALVLELHRLADRLEVLVERVVVLVGLKQGDDPG